MEIIKGDITRPKSENIIIPANTKGLMNRGILSYIAKESVQTVPQVAQEYLAENPCEVGDVFTTGAVHLRRRGVRNIYYAVIKRLPTDFTSIDIVRRTLEKCCSKVRKDKVQSVALCGLGIDKGDLDIDSVARVFFSVIKKYEMYMSFKVVDMDDNFIRVLSEINEKGA
tara:strand:+ start:514 stop:1020 length:507 start_codon:yes stop_codon:yes gene_type:complete